MQGVGEEQVVRHVAAAAELEAVAGGVGDDVAADDDVGPRAAIAEEGDIVGLVTAEDAVLDQQVLPRQIARLHAAQKRAQKEAEDARQQMVDTIRGVYELYGFVPLSTPAIEYDDVIRVEHAPHGWAYIHPVQDVQGKKMEVDAGFRSRSSVIGEREHEHHWRGSRCCCEGGSAGVAGADQGAEFGNGAGGRRAGRDRALARAGEDSARFRAFPVWARWPSPERSAR